MTCSFTKYTAQLAHTGARTQRSLSIAGSSQGRVNPILFSSIAKGKLFTILSSMTSLASFADHFPYFGVPLSQACYRRAISWRQRTKIVQRLSATYLETNIYLFLIHLQISSGLCSVPKPATPGETLYCSQLICLDVF